MADVRQIARKCMQVREDGSAPWCPRAMSTAEVVRLLHALAREVEGGQDGKRHEPWTEEEVRELARLYGGGARVEEIAARLGRTRCAVRSRMTLLRHRGVDIRRGGGDRGRAA